MKQNSNLFDDMARVASGAAGTLLEMKQEIESQVRAQVEKIMGGAQVVSREEFEMVKEMASKARMEQERLAARLDALEKTLSNQKTRKTPAAKKD